MSSTNHPEKSPNYADIVRSFSRSNLPVHSSPPDGEIGNSNALRNHSPPQVPSSTSKHTAVSESDVGPNNLPAATHHSPEHINAPNHNSPPTDPSKRPMNEEMAGSTHNTQNPEPDPSLLNDLSASCLLGKPFGDSIPVSVVTAKLRREWTMLKGHVTFVDMGNGWIMFKFANNEDKLAIWNNRPWYVQSLILALFAWQPAFNPFTFQIHTLAIWVRLNLLPLEFWSNQCLSYMLKPVGPIIRIDDFTLSRTRARYARVCVDVKVLQTVPGSLLVNLHGLTREIFLTYEGMLEVCPLCGSEEHTLDTCKEKTNHTLQLVVDKLQASNLNPSNKSCPPPENQPETDSSGESSGRWIKVVPKRKSRTPTVTKNAKARPSSFKPPPTETTKDSDPECKETTHPIETQTNPPEQKTENIPETTKPPTHTQLLNDKDVEALLATETIDEADPQVAEVLQMLETSIPPIKFPPMLNEYGSNLHQVSPSIYDLALVREISEADKLFFDALGTHKDMSISSDSTKRRRTEDEADSASSKQIKKK
ncbi:hypothetical protein BVRB_5g127080 [Beta vulgaris subsp. vulgaris]|uniref:DUF4283 domain-containing protein n=1 Tax=Beta vulgaris subsp. vulgaris TaxID=3555 RepID=A0A0J8BBN1_BETVV|nr:hypothetical protein BVRB_5g127080 [Beta vulgaris subsp. vulgaris]